MTVDHELVTVEVVSTNLPDWALAQRRAVGNRIRQLREERDVAQDALSLGVGLGKDAAFRAENASNAVTLDTLLLLASGLGVPPSAFFDGIPRGPGQGWTSAPPPVSHTPATGPAHNPGHPADGT